MVNRLSEPDPSVITFSQGDFANRITAAAMPDCRAARLPVCLVCVLGGRGPKIMHAAMLFFKPFYCHGLGLGQSVTK